MRAKYDSLKKAVRQKVADLNQEKRGTGGGPAKTAILTPNEEKIKGVLIGFVDLSLRDRDKIVVSA